MFGRNMTLHLSKKIFGGKCNLPCRGKWTAVKEKGILFLEENIVVPIITAFAYGVVHRRELPMSNT